MKNRQLEEFAIGHSENMQRNQQTEQLYRLPSTFVEPDVFAELVVINLEVKSHDKSHVDYQICREYEETGQNR